MFNFSVDNQLLIQTLGCVILPVTLLYFQTLISPRFLFPWVRIGSGNIENLEVDSYHRNKEELSQDIINVIIIY